MDSNMKTTDWAMKQPPSQAMLLTTAEKPYKILHVNQEWSRMTGYALAEARGNTLEMLQGPKTAKQELAKLRKALQEQKEVTVLLTNYTKKRDQFDVELTVIPLVHPQGSEVVQFMGILRPALSDKLEHLRSLEIENLIPQPESTESNSPAMLDQGDDMLGRTASTETCRTHRSTHPGSTVAHRRETPYMEDYNAEVIWKKRLSLADGDGCLAKPKFGKELGGVSKFRQEHSSLSAPQERASSQMQDSHRPITVFRRASMEEPTMNSHRPATQFRRASLAEPGSMAANHRPSTQFGRASSTEPAMEDRHWPSTQFRCASSAEPAVILSSVHRAGQLFRQPTDLGLSVDEAPAAEEDELLECSLFPCSTDYESRKQKGKTFCDPPAESATAKAAACGSAEAEAPSSKFKLRSAPSHETAPLLCEGPARTMSHTPVSAPAAPDGATKRLDHYLSRRRSCEAALPSVSALHLPASAEPRPHAAGSRPEQDEELGARLRRSLFGASPAQPRSRSQEPAVPAVLSARPSSAEPARSTAPSLCSPLAKATGGAWTEATQAPACTRPLSRLKPLPIPTSHHEPLCEKKRADRRDKKSELKARLCCPCPRPPAHAVLHHSCRVSLSVAPRPLSSPDAWRWLMGVDLADRRQRRHQDVVSSRDWRRSQNETGSLHTTIEAAGVVSSGESHLGQLFASSAGAVGLSRSTYTSINY